MVTVALALGMQRMVRRMPYASPTSGRDAALAKVICSDKTGTLTVGEMTARNW